jgi:hypothetical protein
VGPTARRPGVAVQAASTRSRPLTRDYGGGARSAELADSIAGHQRVISEHEGAMLREIAEFDRTEAWRGDGALSMRDWLVARCRVGAARARTLVESAGKVAALPRLTDALCDGRLTLDVFAPVAAVATPRTDADLAQASAQWTPRQAKALVAEVRGATTADSVAVFRRRCVRFDDHRCSLWAQLSKDSYALVKSALVGRARRHDHPSARDEEYERFESRCADALVQICVEGGRRRPRPRPRAAPTAAADPADHTSSPAVVPDGDSVYGSGRTTMIVHADLDRLLHGDGYGRAAVDGVGPISAEVARRLACNAHLTLSLDAPDGTCLDQKQFTRDPTEAQRIEIRRRDNGCRFPGCTCRNVTDVHHVVWSSKQGPTVLSNLLTLCVAHHSRVHELGWRLDGDAQTEVRFTSPHGRVFVSTPSPTWRPPRK